MKIITYLFAGTAALVLTNISYAEGDVAAGKAKSAVCATCHGTDGIAINPAYPNLAGQNAEYLRSALKAYRSELRQGGMATIMQMQAKNLSDEEIENLATYYASLE